MDDLIYEWPPNVDSYESRIILGLTWTEAIITAMGFMLPVMAQKGLMLGILFGLLAFAAIKRFERLGSISLPQYGWYRLQAWRSQEHIELPLIVSSMNSNTGIVLEDFDGTVLSVE